MTYTREQADQLSNRCVRIVSDLQALMLRGLVERNAPMPEQAKVYLAHGVGRRLEVIRKSLAKIYELFPPSRTEPLPHELATDVQVYLHAFVINLYGVFDNWAWAFVLRHGLFERLGNRRLSVGVFIAATQVLLPVPLREFVTSREMADWHAAYLKGYRDALAHRLPLYLPPAVWRQEDQQRYNELETEKIRLIQHQDWARLDEAWTEQDALGTACYQFLHEYAGDEGARPVLLHPQLLSDSLTVIEFGNRFYAAWHEHS